MKGTNAFLCVIKVQELWMKLVEVLARKEQTTQAISLDFFKLMSMYFDVSTSPFKIEKLAGVRPSWYNWYRQVYSTACAASCQAAYQALFKDNIIWQSGSWLE